MRKTYSVYFILVVVSFTVGFFLTSFWSEPSNNGLLPAAYSQATVAFCPSPECTRLPVSVIDSAQARVDVAMYSFTNQDFADALIRAHARGIDVRVIVEKQQAGSRFSQHVRLATAGIPVRIDSNPNLMHHKFAVLDEEILVNGSMNWTGNGVSENNENVVIIYSPGLNSLFASEFEKVWNDSDAYAGE